MTQAIIDERSLVRKNAIHASVPHRSARNQLPDRVSLSATPWYGEHVSEIEHEIGVHGFHSASAQLLDQEFAIEHYSDISQSSEGEARLRGRTPVHVDRDRILFSKEFRRLDDKNHLLFIDNARLSRNYTSHSLRASHVGRSVAHRLGLNAELADAIILGSKVGGVPFVHRGKSVVKKWIVERVNEVDAQAPDRYASPSSQLLTNSAGRTPSSRSRKSGPGSSDTPTLLDLDPNTGEVVVPSWISNLESRSVREEVSRAIPWASGFAGAEAWHSGPQSYWSLTTNPYLRTSASNNRYLSQTMYGIWRHSLNPDHQSAYRASSFEHKMTLESDGDLRVIASHHLTHEAVLGRYCDDITWVLENLGEASRTSALAGAPESAYRLLARQHKEDLPTQVKEALNDQDGGMLYTYFIDDLFGTSGRNFDQLTAGHEIKESSPGIALSDDASWTLRLMKDFLDAEIFSDRRLDYRNKTLDKIIETALDVLYSAYGQIMPEYLKRQARLDGWFSDRAIEEAMKNTGSKVNRIQACVDILAAMSDKDVYDLLGLE